MNFIKRYEILKKMAFSINDGNVKVISGPKGCGKQTLINDFKSQLSIIDPNFNFIMINGDKFSGSNKKINKKIMELFYQNYNGKVINIFIIENCQKIKEYLSIINDVLQNKKVEIFLSFTGEVVNKDNLAIACNSKILEIKVLPFSFSEFISYQQQDKSLDELFEKYVLLGGYPGSYRLKSDGDKKKYFEELIQEGVIDKLSETYHINNQPALDYVISYLIYNSCYTTSYRKMSEHLTNAGKAVDHKTIQKYMAYLEQAGVFYKVPRYDIKRKQVLSTNFKYYLPDHVGLLNKVVGTTLQKERIYNIIVSNELRRRGFDVFSGAIYDDEIDFVAMKGQDRIYIQVRDDLNKGNVYQNAIGPLKRIKDHYPKLVLVRTHNSIEYDEGIKIMDLPTFLSQDL